MTIRGYIEPNYGRGQNRQSKKDRRKRRDARIFRRGCMTQISAKNTIRQLKEMSL